MNLANVYTDGRTAEEVLAPKEPQGESAPSSVDKKTVDKKNGVVGGLSTIEKWIDQWIRLPEIGLRFDPFREQFAEEDSRLPLYLVDHGAFSVLWGDWISAVFAPAGGGKTAFRVRLLHACRTREDGRRIFPIPVVDILPSDNALARVTRGAARELLLHLLFSPSTFLSLSQEDRQEVGSLLRASLLADFDFLVDRLEDLVGSIQATADWNRLTELFDPAAAELFSPPSPKKVQRFLEQLKHAAAGEPPSDPTTRFERFKRLLFGPLKYETVYVVIDGVDAHTQDAGQMKEVLKPFIELADGWKRERIFAKFFLPLELRNYMVKSKSSHLLTTDRQFAIIEWSKEELQELIRFRLQAAAEESRAFASLDALCTPALRRTEEALLEAVRPNPRDVVRIVETLFATHVRRAGGPFGRLEPEDLDEAIRLYREQSQKSR